MIRAALLAAAAVVAAAGCARGPDPDPLGGNAPFAAGPYGPGGPPQIGALEARVGDRIVSRGVFDYSVGAVDPGATGRAVPEGFLLYVTGADPADPLLDAGRLRLEATLPALAAGSGPATVTLVGAGDAEGARLSGPGTLTLVEVTPPPEDTSTGLYGSILGRFEATLCPEGGAPATPCVPAAGSFSTAFYESLP